MTTPTMPSTDQPAVSIPPATGQFLPAESFAPPAAASTYPTSASGSFPGYPAGDRAGVVPIGFAAEPSAMVPPAPARRRTGWVVAGCTLLAVALLQLTRLPEWIAYDERGMVGNLTGVVALVGIGIALIVTGRQRAR